MNMRHDSAEALCISAEVDMQEIEAGEEEEAMGWLRLVGSLKL